MTHPLPDECVTSSSAEGMDYQPARALPICSLYTYVATDVCRPVTGSEVKISSNWLSLLWYVQPGLGQAELLSISRLVIAIIIHLMYGILTIYISVVRT